MPALARYTVHRTVLDNGMVLLVVENPVADIVAGRIFIRAGSRREKPTQAGLANLVSAVLTKGTDQLSSLEIAEQVESVGASLGADAAADYFLVSLKTVSSDFAEVLGLVGQLLRSPAFPEEEVELERRLALHNIRAQKEQPFAIAHDRLRQALYHHHPYALSGLGTEDSVSGLSQEDLMNFHQTYFRPDQMVISLSGRISGEEALSLVQKTFGDWDIPTSSLPSSSSIRPLLKPQQIITPQETQQSIIMVGYLAASVHDPAYSALKLLNTYLGNGLSSRLFVELREKRGLAYDVSAFYPTREEASSFVTYMGTAPANTEIALDGLQQEVERLTTTLLTPEELQACKNKLLGQYALGKQTNSQIAQVFGWYETIGLGLEFDTRFQKEIAEITSEAAQEVAKEYFNSGACVSLVGPGEVLQALGEW